MLQAVGRDSGWSFSAAFFLGPFRKIEIGGYFSKATSPGIQGSAFFIVSGQHEPEHLCVGPAFASFLHRVGVRLLPVLLFKILQQEFCIRGALQARKCISLGRMDIRAISLGLLDVERGLVAFVSGLRLHSRKGKA